MNDVALKVPFKYILNLPQEVVKLPEWKSPLYTYGLADDGEHTLAILSERRSHFLDDEDFLIVDVESGMIRENDQLGDIRFYGDPFAVGVFDPIEGNKIFTSRTRVLNDNLDIWHRGGFIVETKQWLSPKVTLVLKALLECQVSGEELWKALKARGMDIGTIFPFKVKLTRNFLGGWTMETEKPMSFLEFLVCLQATTSESRES